MGLQLPTPLSCTTFLLKSFTYYNIRLHRSHARSADEKFERDGLERAFSGWLPVFGGDFNGSIKASFGQLYVCMFARKIN